MLVSYRSLLITFCGQFQKAIPSTAKHGDTKRRFQHLPAQIQIMGTEKDDRDIQTLTKHSSMSFGVAVEFGAII